MTAQGLASSQTSRIKALQDKHAAISHQVKEAQISLSTTDYYLNQLKKQKLLLKEEIEGLRSRTSAN